MEKFVIFIIGAPCAGKSALRHYLVAEIEKWPGLSAEQIQSFAVGDLLRQEVANQTEIGRQIQSCTDKGLLVPYETWVPLLKERLNRKDIAVTVMDGYLSGREALEAFNELLKENKAFIVRRHTLLDLILKREEQCRQERQACSRQDLSNFHARLEEYLRFSAPLWPRICRMFGDYAISVSGRKEAKETAAELSAIIQARLTSVY